jgi:hypothetical protein
MTRAALFACLAVVAASSTVSAEDISMAAGKLRFATPANWLAIMQTQGDPEVQVFQVPDPSPAGSQTLARVTVTVKMEPDVTSFQQYVAQASAKGKALTGYVAARSANPLELSYSAQEAGARLAYHERYWFTAGMAIQLRCVRPATGDARWTAAFDGGCASVAAAMPQ